MTTSWLELVLLWSAIFTYDTFVCAADVPRIILGNGTVLSYNDEVTIEYGQPLQLFCSGNVSNLIMSKGAEDLIIDTLNKTTVRYLAEKPERQHSNYYCADSQISTWTVVTITVDSPPFVTEFHCKSKNHEYLNCTWASENVYREFSLYYMKEDAYEITKNFRLCKVGTSYDSMYCVWDFNNPSLPFQMLDQKLNFLMETCNSWGCANQTFVFNHIAITQPDPPKLSLFRTYSRSADLISKIPEKLWAMDRYMEHRASYWYSGHQIQDNTAYLVEYKMPLIIFNLKLPCAGTFYEIRLSIKPKTAVGEEFWSEDAVISFVTELDPEYMVATVDPTCVRPRVPITRDIMLYEIEKFRDKMEKEQNELKERIWSLKLRVQND